MNKTYDSQAHSGYITFSNNKVLKTVPVSEQVLCDIDAQGMLVWIEFIGVSQPVFNHMEKNMKVSEVV